MAEQTAEAKVTKVFTPIVCPDEVNMMLVLAAFARKKGSIGLTEDDMGKESGLGNGALHEVAKLEKEGFIRSFLCQEGTAGPFSRRYKLVDGAGIELRVSRPA